MKKIKTFEILSAIGTIGFGSMLHFAYAWSGNWRPMALIAAVNESTWEHLKLAFWPAFIFALIAYFVVKMKPKNFCLAQMVKFVSMPILIIVLFYAHQLFFSDSLIYDISIFWLAVILGHVFSYQIEKSSKDYNLEKLSTVLIIIILLKFSLFTYFPIQNFLFLDPVTNLYGIIK